MSRWERINQRVVRYIPIPVLAAPEQILLNGACVLIGLNVLIHIPDRSLMESWPHWASLEWGAAMMVGGCSTLYGVWTQRRMPSRFGFLLLAVACTVYAGSIVAGHEWRGVASALVFFGIAGAKVIRLMAGSAYRAELIRAGHVRGFDRDRE